MYQYGDSRKIYHIGNDHEISILKLAEIIGRIMNVDLDIIPGRSAIGGTPRRCPDISRMRKIGYKPNFDIEEGIQKTVKWYKNNQIDNLKNSLS